MQLIPLSSISIGPRQRKKLESQPLADLETAIEQRGLINPPTYRKVPDTDPAVWQLVAGERRTRAIQRLSERKVEFYCNGAIVPVGMIPILTLHEALTRADLKQVEFDENKLREALPWQDEAEALAEIHRLRQEENPGAHPLAPSKQTVMDTARELVSAGAVEHTSPKALANRIQQSITLTEHLNDPTIAKARNATEAYNLVVKKNEEAVNAAIARRRLANIGETPAIVIRRGDCLTVLPQLDTGVVDLILTDPPYGIAADKGGFRQRTVHHHNYEDTPEKARAIAQSIILDGFRIAKPMANMFMFCDIDLFPMLKEMAGRVGWTVFRTPIIWQKSLSEGMAPWQGKGFRRTYEVIFYATKGQRGLISSPVDILTYKRVPRDERTHAAEKPIDLLRALIECSTLPGDYVLDPCCGSGSTLVAAKASRRTGMGIELEEEWYNTAMSNVHKPPEDTSAPLHSGPTVESLA